MNTGMAAATGAGCTAASAAGTGAGAVVAAGSASASVGAGVGASASVGAAIAGAFVGADSGVGVVPPQAVSTSAAASATAMNCAHLILMGILLHKLDKPPAS